MAETLAELSKRVVKLEAEIEAMAARLAKLEAALPNRASDRRQAEAQYEITSLIG